MKRFSKGFFSLLEAFSFLLREPKLIKYVIIPFLLSCTIFSITAYVTISHYDDLLQSILVSTPDWLDAIIKPLAWIVFAFIFVIISYYTFSILGNIICAPFNDILSLKVLEARGLTSPVEMPFIKSALKSMCDAAIFSLIKIFILLISFIPGLQFLAIVALPLFVIMDFYDYPISHMVTGLRNKFARVLKEDSSCLGFGLSFSMLFAIPLVLIALMPVAVVAASLMVKLPDQSS